MARSCETIIQSFSASPIEILKTTRHVSVTSMQYIIVVLSFTYVHGRSLSDITHSLPVVHNSHAYVAASFTSKSQSKHTWFRFFDRDTN